VKYACAWLILAGTCWALLGGCQETIYRPSTGGYLGAKITPKQAWRAGGTISHPAAAVDGDLTTAATGESGNPGAELRIDLGEVCLFQTIIVDHGRDEHAYPPSVRVATSLDGKAFTRRYVGPGTRRVTILSLTEPVLARYLRLAATGRRRRRWSVAEVYLQ